MASSAIIVHDGDDDPMEPRPPEGVFRALGAMTSGDRGDDADANDDDDKDDDERIRRRARDLLGEAKGGGVDVDYDDYDDAEARPKGVDGTPDDTLTPRFSETGKFVGYESRGTCIEDRGVADILFNGTTRDVKDAFRRNRRCRGTIMGFAIFIFAVIVALIFFLVGDLIGTAVRNGGSSSQQSSAVADGGDGKAHTHPKMNHTRPPNHSPSHASPMDPTAVIPGQAPASSPAMTSYPPTYRGTPTSGISSTETYDPRALATIKRNEPDNKFAGLQELGVERDQRVSFVRFDLSEHQYDVDEVFDAKLLLNLISHDQIDEGGTKVDVDVLPYAGGWIEDTLTWNSPPNTTDAATTNTFLWAGEMGDVEFHLLEVDVTAAVLSSVVTTTRGANDVTFRLSTESGGFLFFASRRWNNGDGMPTLVIRLK
jgi:hypothetical protein